MRIALTAVSSTPRAVTMMTMISSSRLLDLLQHLQAVDAGQLDIEQHQVGGLLPDQPQGILPGAGGKDLVSLLLQVLLQGPADQMLVIDHQDFLFTHHQSSLSPSGSAG